MIDCKHRRIHTERLLRNTEKPYQYIIESICADCGLFLKMVDVWDGIKKKYEKTYL